jgi:iron complex outermembrane receptor protein
MTKFHKSYASAPPAPGKAWDYQAGLFFLDAEVFSDDPSYYGPDAGAWVATRAQYNTLIANENAPLRAAGRELLRASHDGIYQSSVTDATTRSLAVYGQADWHLTDKANLAFGLRLTDESKNNKIATELDRPGQNLDRLGTQLGATTAQINAAKAVRLRSIPITPFSFVQGKPIDDTLVAWNISPSYKLTPDINLYASVDKGVNAGFIYFQQYVAPTDIGFETSIKAEETLDVTLGFKSLLLDRTLQWNANLYNTAVCDYQASWRRNNPDTPGETIAGWGNAPKVVARGLETELHYRLNAELDLNLAAAYNKATYEAEWLVQKPEILVSNQYFDAKDQQIANVPKTVINYGLSYVTPWEGFLWRATLQNTFKSHSYFNDNQAEFTRQGSYSISN